MVSVPAIALDSTLDFDEGLAVVVGIVSGVEMLVSKFVVAVDISEVVVAVVATVVVSEFVVAVDVSEVVVAVVATVVVSEFVVAVDVSEVVVAVVATVVVSEFVVAVDVSEVVVAVVATVIVDPIAVSTVDCVLDCSFPEFSVVKEVVPGNLFESLSVLVKIFSIIEF